MPETEILEEDDLALVHALQIHPRARWVDLAPILDSHPTTLAARWDRLEQKGQAWVAAHQVGALHSGCLAFVDVECEMDMLSGVVDEVCAIPEVTSVDLSARNRDLMLTVTTSALQQLTDDVLPRLPRIRGIRRFQTSICTMLHSGGDAWRLSALSKQQQTAVANLRPQRVERSGPVPKIASELLAALEEDGRATAVELARRVGCHPTTAQRHLAKITQHHVLSFRCEVAQRAVGVPVTCMWFGRVPAGTHEEVGEALASFPELRLAASTTGRTNFLITMWLRSVDEIMDMEHRILQAVPQIRMDECAVAVTIVKRVGRRLNIDGTLAD